MYSSIYRVQSNTRRLPIRALFGFTLKLVEFYLSPSPQSLCVVVCPWCQPWVASSLLTSSCGADWVPDWVQESRSCNAAGEGKMNASSWGVLSCSVKLNESLSSSESLSMMHARAFVTTGDGLNDRFPSLANLSAPFTISSHVSLFSFLIDCAYEALLIPHWQSALPEKFPACLLLVSVRQPSSVHI